MRWGTLGEDSVRVLGSSKGWGWAGLGLGDGLERVLVSVAVSRQSRTRPTVDAVVTAAAARSLMTERVDRRRRMVMKFRND